MWAPSTLKLNHLYGVWTPRLKKYCIIILLYSVLVITLCISSRALKNIIVVKHGKVGATVSCGCPASELDAWGVVSSCLESNILTQLVSPQPPSIFNAWRYSRGVNIEWSAFYNNLKKIVSKKKEDCYSMIC